MNEGSPYWKTEIDIKNHFNYYKKIFGWWKKNGIEPMTISEYGQNHKLKNNC